MNTSYKRVMNILIVPSWYKTKSNPTLGSFFYEQARMLKKMGHTVIIADVSLQGRKEYFSGRCYRLLREEDGGIIVYSFVVPSFGKFNQINGGVDSVYKNLKKVYRKILADGLTIDVIHAHSYLPAGVAAVKLAGEESVPIVVTEHSSELLSTDIKEERVNLLSDVVKACNKFVCVSNRLRESVLTLTKCSESKVIVIPNVVDEMFSYKPSRKTKNCFTFISVGNLIQSKRFDLTIEAFSKAFAGKERVALKIVGDGFLRKQLENRVKLLGEENRITFYGRISREEVVKQLQESDCLVLPSDYETFGVVYIEALATGNPVIGTKNGGAEDIITLENGILVDRDDVNQLSEAMYDIFRRNDCYDRKSIACLTMKKYGQLAIASKLEKLYGNIIELN